MNRKKIAYFLIIVSFVLLIFNLTEFDFKNLSTNRYSGIASNVLLILAMLVSIRDINKKETKK